jgi:Zn-dependent peptidase ImmA (M78 family)
VPDDRPRLRPGFKADAERIALELRAELGLGPADKLDPRDLARHLGIPVIPLRELKGEVEDAHLARLLAKESPLSALTVCAGTRRLIVFNQRHAPTRRSNSLAHELAHVILEHPPGPVLDPTGHRRWDAERETEADWQAGALLVPREGALAWLMREKSPDGGEKHFGVSRALFLWRVHQTGAVRQFGARFRALRRPRL